MYLCMNGAQRRMKCDISKKHFQAEFEKKKKFRDRAPSLFKRCYGRIVQLRFFTERFIGLQEVQDAVRIKTLLLHLNKLLQLCTVPLKPENLEQPHY